MLEKIFSYSRYGYRHIYKILGSKITISLKKKYVNKFISLGCNCYTRQILTFNGIKPRKKDGELSFPFDVIPINETIVAELLSSDFKNFFDNIIFKEDAHTWSNGQGIIFPHDKVLSKEEFVERYKKRINNLYNTLKTKKNCIVYSTKFFDKPCNSEDLNSIYDSLTRIADGNGFKYYFFHLVTDDNKEGHLLAAENLNKNIIYDEIKIGKEYASYWSSYWNSDEICEYCNKIYNTISETSNL